MGDTVRSMAAHQELCLCRVSEYGGCSIEPGHHCHRPRSQVEGARDGGLLAQGLALLDYSLNKVEIFLPKSTDWFDLFSGMEHLIRNLFSLAVSNASYPTVVLLETYPHGPSSTGQIDFP